MATTAMFSGIQWFDTNRQHPLKTVSQELEPALDIMLPITFIGPDQVVTGSSVGNVVVTNREGTIQVLQHSVGASSSKSIFFTRVL
jgi:hypothetical protein